MKTFVFAATVWVTALAMLPGAYACGGSTEQASPQHTGLQDDAKPATSEAGFAVLVGLLLGLAVTDQVATPCRGCADTR